MGGRNAFEWYDKHGLEVAERYESLRFEQVHNWLIYQLPEVGKGTILDVGAGSGRDAAWFAARGHEVVAVEPSWVMREEAKRRHPSPRIQWLDDRLPGLTRTTRSGAGFDVILLSAVWMHVCPGDRPRAFRKLINLLKPGGLLAISVRSGPVDPDRAMHESNREEIEALARAHGAFVEKVDNSADRLGRADIHWEHLAIRLPDDGTGALPLVRHVILNDDKSSTYKLALLRVLCRIADGADGMARDAGDEKVALPLGLVALYWLRLYHPLVRGNLPQAPEYRDGRRLGFVKEPFLQVIEKIPARDLRVGMRFSGDRAQCIHRALNDARHTLSRQPAYYMTFPSGQPVVEPKPQRLGSVPEQLLFDKNYFLSFGELLVPRNIWHAFQRFSVWVEPAITGEWLNLMKLYAERRGYQLDESAGSAALIWPELKRDVTEARENFMRLIANGKPVHCVWSGSRLRPSGADIDHCFPWAAWPCGDLWNLLPTRRKVNANKGARLPTAEKFQDSRERILDWWEQAYLSAPSSRIAERFIQEALASLPTLENQEGIDLEDIFQAADLRRLRLRQDQQVPEWQVG